MPSENRVPHSDSAPSRRGLSPPFYRVEQRVSNDTTRHYVVHTQSPKFLVEFEDSHAAAPEPGQAAGPRSRPVIRRVCVPNSWAGDYHRCARQLGAASDFYAATDRAE